MTHRSWVAWTALVTALVALVLSIVALAGGGTREAAAPVVAPTPAERGSRGEVGGEPSRPVPSSRVATESTGEDRHWLQSDDYFISDRPWQSDWMNVHLAKRMKQPSEPSGKDEVLFFQLDNSREVWVSDYWRTHAAEPAELALGMLVVCFEGNRRDSVYRAPKDKAAARTNSWFLAKITDLSDLPKGWVRMHTYNCAVDAVRVLDP